MACFLSLTWTWRAFISLRTGSISCVLSLAAKCRLMITRKRWKKCRTSPGRNTWQHWDGAAVASREVSQSIVGWLGNNHHPRKRKVVIFGLMLILVDFRHHHSGRWEARLGRVIGNKYLYLGTYGEFLEFLNWGINTPYLFDFSNSRLNSFYPFLFYLAYRQ